MTFVSLYPLAACLMLAAGVVLLIRRGQSEPARHAAVAAVVSAAWAALMAFQARQEALAGWVRVRGRRPAHRRLVHRARGAIDRRVPAMAAPRRAGGRASRWWRLAVVGWASSYGRRPVRCLLAVLGFVAALAALLPAARVAPRHPGRGARDPLVLGRRRPRSSPSTCSPTCRRRRWRRRPELGRAANRLRGAVGLAAARARRWQLPVAALRVFISRQFAFYATTLIVLVPVRRRHRGRRVLRARECGGSGARRCRRCSSVGAVVAADRLPAGGMAAAAAARVHHQAFLSQQVRLPPRVAAFRPDAVDRRGRRRASQRHPRRSRRSSAARAACWCCAIPAGGAVLSAGGLARRARWRFPECTPVRGGRSAAAIPARAAVGRRPARIRGATRSSMATSRCPPGWARAPGAWSRRCCVGDQLLGFLVLAAPPPFDVNFEDRDLLQDRGPQRRRAARAAPRRRAARREPASSKPTTASRRSSCTTSRTPPRSCSCWSPTPQPTATTRSSSTTPSPPSAIPPSA